ncbi:serine/threonine protein kinase [Sulfidibacter corallicola]|uniref:Serine/threonine protein kinase n=2 Tax=Sulfidibacter corallicola TaxID=2818388 RepID=A0A8A4TTQ0_SULCO|nr:serine/threonine protein kinase [Sulfidibacter corallicola]
MGSSYLASDSVNGRTVVLQTIELNFNNEDLKEQFLTRLKEEARVCTKLKDERIAPVYDMGQADGMPYIAVTARSGRTLSQLLEENGLDLNGKVKVLAEIGQALDVAHQQNMVHGALNPSQILVTSQRDILMLDFALNRLGEEEMAKLGSNIAPPAYASPEKVKGQSVDARSDLFSLGILSHEVLTGKSPFLATTAVTMIYQIAESDPVLHDVPGLSPDKQARLKDFFTRALSKEPGQRFQSGNEFCADLYDSFDAWDADALGGALSQNGPDTSPPIPLDVTGTVKIQFTDDMKEMLFGAETAPPGLLSTPPAPKPEPPRPPEPDKSKDYLEDSLEDTFDEAEIGATISMTSLPDVDESSDATSHPEQVTATVAMPAMVPPPELEEESSDDHDAGTTAPMPVVQSEEPEPPPRVPSPMAETPRDPSDTVPPGMGRTKLSTAPPDDDYDYLEDTEPGENKKVGSTVKMPVMDDAALSAFSDRYEEPSPADRFDEDLASAQVQGTMQIPLGELGLEPEEQTPPPIETRPRPLPLPTPEPTPPIQQTPPPLTTPVAPPAEPAPPQPATSAGSSKLPLLIGGGVLALVLVVALIFLIPGGDKPDEDPVPETPVSTTRKIEIGREYQGASVFLGERFLGQAPLSFDFEKQEGSSDAVTLVCSGFLAHSVDLNPEDQGDLQMDMAMVPGPIDRFWEEQDPYFEHAEAPLVISVLPEGAMVLINDEPVGTEPAFLFPHDWEEQDINITVYCPGYEAETLLLPAYTWDSGYMNLDLLPGDTDGHLLFQEPDWDGNTKLLTSISPQREDEDGFWQKTRRSNSTRAYRAYLKKFPKGKFVSDATRRIERLELENELDKIINVGNLDQLQAFLNRHPDLGRSNKAQSAIKNLQFVAKIENAFNADDIDLLNDLIDQNGDISRRYARWAQGRQAELQSRHISRAGFDALLASRDFDRVQGYLNKYNNRSTQRTRRARSLHISLMDERERKLTTAVRHESPNRVRLRRRRSLSLEFTFAGGIPFDVADATCRYTVAGKTDEIKLAIQGQKMVANIPHPELSSGKMTYFLVINDKHGNTYSLVNRVFTTDLR